MTDNQWEAVRRQETRNSQIQGFLYGDRHVIRDCLRTTGQQILWEFETKNYDEGHSAMMDKLRRIKFERCIESMERSV